MSAKPLLASTLQLSGLLTWIGSLAHLVNPLLGMVGGIIYLIILINKMISTNTEANLEQQERQLRIAEERVKLKMQENH